MANVLESFDVGASLHLINPLIIVMCILVLVPVLFMVACPLGQRYLLSQIKGGQSYSLIFLILFVSATMVLIFTKYRHVGHSIANFCFIPRTDSAKPFLHETRGQNFNVDSTLEEEDPVKYAENKEKINTCLGTGWSALHFLLYFILGFLAPKLLWLTLIIGVLFEVFESFVDCHDLLDVAYNTGGAVAGAALRMAVLPV